MDLGERSRTHPAQLIAIGGGVVLVIAALMPWATVRSGFGQLSASGIEGDGAFTLIIGGFVGLAGWLRMDRRGWRIAMVILCALAVLVAGYDMANVNSITGSEFADVAVGAGLYLTLIAAVVAGIAVLIEESNRRTPLSNE